MNNSTRLSKKTKTFLSVATAIIASTAVTTLLTSCSSAKESDIIDTGGYDKEYGISDATYTRMEDDFKTLYRSQLDEKKSSGEIDDSTYNLNLSKFENNLNSIHTSLYSDENKTLSYTIRTNVLRDYARNNYGIRLSRQSNVSLSVTISGIKNSIVDSVLLLCKEYKMADVDTKKYRENAETEFDKLYKEAKSKYAEDDVVSIVQYVQTGMIGCFKGICKEIDCLAAQQQLKDFIANYEINVKENLDKNYYWDKLLSKYGKGGKEISVEDFNSIFTMTYEETDPQSSSSSYFSTTKKTKEFRNDLITGYTLKPILVEMNGDSCANVYSIDVDYTLVNNNYKDADDVAKLTVHSSALKDKSFYENENISIFDLNANESEREYTNYELPITIEYEKEQINNTYFNQDFKFTWSTSEEYGYDDFWTEPNENGEYKGKLNVFGLATSGMMINGVLLSDILYQAGKISLSGGSVSLSGKAKTKGEDSKQWKLTVDGNEIKNENICWKLVSATTVNLPDSIRINDGVVSWTDKIETGTYNFHVLANYKETKIQTDLITLNISSEQSESIQSFSNQTWNTLYDENTIDQKLLNFVKYVHFSLDYTENDYGTDKDGKKGEINVDDFTIGYKNSKNTFEASNEINEAISSAINNDSGITKRASNNFWENIKANYDNLVSSLDVKGLKESINSVHDTISSTIQTFYLMQGIFATIIATLYVILCIFARFSGWIAPYDFSRTFMLLVCALFVVWILGTIVKLYLTMDRPNEELLKQLDNFDPKKRWSCKIIKNINTDEKYFVSEDGRAEFDKLSIDDMRNKKVYYESGYKLTKKDSDESESESDIEEFWGGKKTCNEMCENLKDVRDGFKWLYFLAVLSGLLSRFLIFLIMIWASKAYSNFLRHLDLEKIGGRVGRQNAWLNNKEGFFQTLSDKYEIFQAKWAVYWENIFNPII